MKYEKPALVELGGSDAGGYSFCTDGSGDAGECNLGPAAGSFCVGGTGVGPT